MPNPPAPCNPVVSPTIAGPGSSSAATSRPPSSGRSTIRSKGGAIHGLRLPPGTHPARARHDCPDHHRRFTTCPSSLPIPAVPASTASCNRPVSAGSSASRPVKPAIAAGNCRGTATTGAAGSSVTCSGGYGSSGKQIHPVVSVSLTETCTRRYEPGALAGVCRITSSKNHCEAITARTPDELARARLSGTASSSRNASLIAFPATPCSS